MAWPEVSPCHPNFSTYTAWRVLETGAEHQKRLLRWMVRCAKMHKHVSMWAFSKWCEQTQNIIKINSQSKRIFKIINFPACIYFCTDKIALSWGGKDPLQCLLLICRLTRKVVTTIYQRCLSSVWSLDPHIHGCSLFISSESTNKSHHPGGKWWQPQSHRPPA
jgi:hypothetical protein